MDILMENIGGESPEPISGLTTTFYIAPHKDFTLLNDPPTFEAVGAFATKAKIATNHTFAEDKGFAKITVVTETGTVKSTMMGERKRRLYQNEITGQISGSDDELLGFMRMVKNGDFVVLVEEFGTGNLRQLGSKRLPAEFTAIEHVVEAAVEGNNSCTFTIQDKQKWPAPIYAGTVALLG